MKKVIGTLSAIGLFVVLIGADIRRNEPSTTIKNEPKKPCYGYTIIEFGKGVNCKGDTILLEKVNGGQRLKMSAL